MSADVNSMVAGWPSTPLNVAAKAAGRTQQRSGSVVNRAIQGVGTPLGMAFAGLRFPGQTTWGTRARKGRLIRVPDPRGCPSPPPRLAGGFGRHHEGSMGPTGLPPHRDRDPRHWCWGPPGSPSPRVTGPLGRAITDRPTRWGQRPGARENFNASCKLRRTDWCSYVM